MMKNRFGLLPLLMRLVVFLASAVAFGAYAQESTDAENAESAEIAPPPQMQRLFYTAEERLELEILRQGRAAAALEESTRVFPVILEEVPLDVDDLEEVVLERDTAMPLEIHAVVRRRSDGKTFLWIGNESFDLKRDGEFLDKTSHLILDPMQISPDGDVIGIDRISRKRFQMRVGQSIDAEGRIRDNYPAIVVRNKKR